MTLRPGRSGSLRSIWLAFLASVVLFALLVGLLSWSPEWWSVSGAGEPLLVYCAASLRVPVETAARQYQQEYGIRIQLQYAGSDALLSGLRTARLGDLYIPADDSYLHKARDLGLLAETLPVATMKPVIAVRRGNPRNIRGLADLLRPEIRLAQANPDVAAIGKVTRIILQGSGEWTALANHTAVNKPTVNDVANDVKVGTVDAGIVWDTTVELYPELEAVAVPQFAATTAQVTLGVLQTSRQPTATLRFARYLSARDRGLPIFADNGFRTVDGDGWAKEPDLVVMAGAMLRPAIEETLEAFRQREGVRITCVYNGCGILVSQMRGGERPDAYFACDKSFMSQVHDLFLDSVDVSTNQLVILVHKGNPHEIHSLPDLAKPGLRVGVGHEKQCALGALTQRTLDQDGALTEVMKNVVVQSPTGDLLVAQLRAGSLDAIIAYVSNATSASGQVEAIPIDVPCAVAVQPIAVGKLSRYKYVTQRLLEAIRSRESRERFESSGFHWQAAR